MPVSQPTRREAGEYESGSVKFRFMKNTYNFEEPEKISGSFFGVVLILFCEHLHLSLIP